jgi:hypothetical protein
MKLNIKLFSTLLLAVLFLIPVSGYAQMSGYDFLNVDKSARAAAIGGAFTGISGDAHALFYNPAGLSGVDKITANISYLNYVLDINSGTIAFTFPREGNNTYAAGINYMNYGDFEGFDNFGNETASFGAQDVLFTGGMARSYSEKIDYGVSVKMLYSSIHNYSSFVGAADLGVIYKIPVQMMTVGLSISNVGYVLQAYDQTKDKVPAAAKLGISKRLAHLPLLLCFEGRQFFDGENQFILGGEFDFSETFQGRIGYNSYGRDQKIGSEGGTLSGISLGFGLKWRQYFIDYSFSSNGIIGNLNRLTLRFII